MAAFREWRSAVERWARDNESRMEALSPVEVADASAHFLTHAQREQLRITGELEVTWEQMISSLRALHGHTTLEVVGRLMALQQDAQESLAEFFCRVEELRGEAKAEESIAKQVLVTGLVPEQAKELQTRIRVMTATVESQGETLLDQLTYSDLKRAMLLRDFLPAAARAVNNQQQLQ